LLKSLKQLFVAVTERVFERHRIGLQQAIENAETNLLYATSSRCGVVCFSTSCPFFEHGT